MTDKAFRESVWEFYCRHGRHDLPWRQPPFDPYRIMVSELMLQQTQVSRVIPKYQAFLFQFPTVKALAKAPLGKVLQEWSGLGYNRRAKFLWQAAGRIVSDFDGQVPASRKALELLPGIGPNTAGAILAYAFDRPTLFIETNIRTVFIHHFFSNAEKVQDKEILDLLARTFPCCDMGRVALQNVFHFASAVRKHMGMSYARVWYWALMDYGAHLKQTVGAQLHKMHGYKPQSKFEGSARQIRGLVLRELGQGSRSLKTLQAVAQDARLHQILVDLEQEGLIEKRNTHYNLTGT